MSTALLDRLVTFVLTSCAIVVVGILVKREFLATPAPGAMPEQKPVLMKDWRNHLSKGIQFGDPMAPVQLIEFADFECHFCATFHNTLRATLAKYPEQVALTFVH